jgi:hypothetical protein
MLSIATPWQQLLPTQSKLGFIILNIFYELVGQGAAVTSFDDAVAVQPKTRNKA